MDDAIARAWRALKWGPPSAMRPVGRGCSDRTYWRADLAEGRKVIVCRYDERAENASFAACAQFLGSLGVPVPAIIYHDPEARLVIQQDLGDLSLQRLAPQLDDKASSEILCRVIAAIRPLHNEDGAAIERHAIKLGPSFDERLYLWESAYFEENLLRRMLGMEISGPAKAQWADERNRLAQELARHPRCLIHRDLQSSNVIICGDKIFFIDFQGIRLGLPEYDIASLVYDSYVAWSVAARDAAYEAFLNRYPPQDRESRARVCKLAGLQRLMQALGVFGFFIARDNESPLNACVLPGLRNLGAVLRELTDFPALTVLQKEALQSATRRLAKGGGLSRR